MQKNQASPHNKNSLFLIEMILSLLFLALICSACVQIFMAARTSRRQAREWNHIQELTTTIGELLEGSDGSPENIRELLQNTLSVTAADDGIFLYFDKNWNPASPSEASYTAALILTQTPGEKGGILTFSDYSEKELYSIPLRFPLFTSQNTQEVSDS